MAKIAIKDVIIDYLKTLPNGKIIPSYDLENDFPNHGKLKFGLQAMISTYSREFRRLRETPAELALAGLAIREVPGESKVKLFQVVR